MSLSANTNCQLVWYRTDTGASVGTSFVPANGITYVSAPLNQPNDGTGRGGAWCFDFVTTASTAGTLTVELSNTPESRAPGGGCLGAAAGATWGTYAPAGWSIPAISGAGTTNLSISQAPGAKRMRLKFVASASAGSVLADGSVG